MKHVGTVPLETPRLILRRFQKSDAEKMYENWASQDAVTKFLTWKSHADVSVTKAVVESWIDSYAKLDFYQWAIVLKETGEPIGSISVVHYVDGNPEIGYCIGEKFWGNGYAPESLKAVLDFLFETVNAQKVIAKHDALNPNSGKVMLKCGMTLVETVLGAYDYSRNINADMCYYQISLSKE